MLKFGARYVDQGEAAYEQRYRDRVFRSLKRRAKELGFELTPINATPVEPALT